MTDFHYEPLFQHAHDRTPVFRHLGSAGVRAVEYGGQEFLHVDTGAISRLTSEAFEDVSHLLRTAHLEKLASILRDPEATANDRFVARELMNNAIIAAGRVWGVERVVEGWLGFEVLLSDV